MYGLHDERRPSSRWQVAVIASILGVGALVTLTGLHSCPGQFSLRGHSFGDRFNDEEMEILSTDENEAQSHPTLKLNVDSEVGADQDVEAISLQPEDQIVAQVPMEDNVDPSQTAAVEDHGVEDMKVKLQRRQDDGANVTSPSSPTDGEQATTPSEPVEPPSTTDPVPVTTTVLTTIVTETEQPEEPTTTSVPPVEPTTTTDLPPPETTSSLPEDSTTTVVPPPETTSVPPPTTTLVTSVTSEEDDEPSSTTEKPEPTTTKEERTTTEAEVTSSAVEKVVTSTLPNGSKTVVTSTTYVEVIAGGGEPTAEPTDPDLQNAAVGLWAGPVGSLVTAFIATVYLLA